MISSPNCGIFPPPVGESSSGRTADSGSAYRGSNPRSPAKLAPSSSGLGRGPLKAETRVRFPLGPPKRTSGARLASTSPPLKLTGRQSISLVSSPYSHTLHPLNGGQLTEGNRGERGRGGRRPFARGSCPSPLPRLSLSTPRSLYRLQLALAVLPGHGDGL